MQNLFLHELSYVCFQFKKEEKLNCAQVDKALRTHLKWDVTNLEEEFKKERREEKEKIEREKMLLADERRKEIERLRSVKSMGLRSGNYYLIFRYDDQCLQFKLVPIENCF